MQYDAKQIVKCIRLAKLEKKYGPTEFATFINVPFNDYAQTYKHVEIKDKFIDPEIERINNEIAEKEAINV